jgi:hypothetical protein
MKEAFELVLVKLAARKVMVRCLLKRQRVYVLWRADEFSLPHRRKLKCFIITAHRANVAKVVKVAHLVLWLHLLTCFW